jgi:ethanolamine utilization protein EutN
MYLGEVIGTVVCERKYEGLQGKRLLIVQPVDHRRQPSGPAEVAVDTVSARRKDLVYLVGAREAALALEPWFVPVDSAIVGIVDSVDV